MNKYNISNYEIDTQKKIGFGPYSSVYQAKNINNKNNILAIKKIVLSNLDNIFSQMLKDEISIMNIIKNNPHPNIVKCYDIIHTIDAVYIVMEYCENGNLSSILGKPMTERKSKFYFKQMVNALLYLDKHKIMHRDIKPKNILLSNNYTSLKLCDFGFAKTINNKKMSTICGSPLYMAPEILNDKTYNDSIDIWAIGIILYELLFGNHPFYKSKNLVDLRDDILNTNINIPPTNLKIRYKLNADCIALVKSLLNKNDNTRIKINDINNHSWFKDYNHDEHIKYLSIDKYESDSDDTSDSDINDSQILGVSSNSYDCINDSEVFEMD
jgi:serine/threonine protein kinase